MREREGLPWHRPVGQAGRVTRRIPRPRSAWLNAVPYGTGGNGDEFLPGAAGASPLRLPQLPGCPATRGGRLCKWNQATTRTMVRLGWRCHQGEVGLRPASKPLASRKKDGLLSWETVF